MSVYRTTGSEGVVWILCWAHQDCPSGRDTQEFELLLSSQARSGASPCAPWTDSCNFSSGHKWTWQWSLTSWWSLEQATWTQRCLNLMIHDEFPSYTSKGGIKMFCRRMCVLGVGTVLSCNSVVARRWGLPGTGVRGQEIFFGWVKCSISWLRWCLEGIYFYQNSPNQSICLK